MNTGSIRSEVNRKAAERLDGFRRQLGTSVRAFAEQVNVPESTLRYFLGNRSVGSESRRHGRGPNRRTFKPLLDFLPSDIREDVLDSIEFESRVVPRLLNKYRRAGAEQ